MSRLRAFLSAEIVLFVCASLLHQGLLANGHGHSKAAVAEGLIAVVLAAGFAICVYWPLASRPVATLAQGLALSGVGVGLVMSFIGVGPRSGLDYGLHGVMVLTLAAGFVTARNLPAQ